MQSTLVSALLTSLFALGAASATAAEPGSFTLSTGLNYSSGTYGTDTTTTITSMPIIARYDRGPWILKLTVPYLRITGASNVIPGVGTVANANPRGRGRGPAGGGTAPSTTTTGTAEGWGDIVAAATYNAYGSADLAVDLTGKVKFGTADADEGLGTGENDYAAQVDVYKTYGRITAFAGLGYNVLGSSQFIQLDNVFNATVGGAYKFDDQTTAGLMLDAREKTSASGHEQSELTAYVTHKLDRHWKTQAYALKGMATGSPDWGVGAFVGYAF